jgi:alkylation response protein AidB-like acyl-CoA dehydrogenase
MARSIASGEKMFASIANETDVGVLFAKTDREAGANGVTAFIVEPKKYPGWTARPIDMLGLSKSFRINVVSLDDFVVPVENRLGEEGEGFKIIMRTLQPGRVGVAAKARGVARAGSVAIRMLEPQRVRRQLRLCDQRVELLGSGRIASLWGQHLSFADAVHGLDSTQDDACTAKNLESQHRPDAALDRPVVLLDEVVQILVLADLNRRFLCGIDGLQRR